MTLRSKPSRLAALALLTVPLALGCTAREDEAAPAPPEIEEFPITTGSDEALTAYRAAQDKLDRKRLREARALFEKAIELDPAFSAAYLGLATSAYSPRAFKENLDRAIEHGADKSEGERLLIEIYRTFLTNDADARLDLARRLTESYPNSPRAWVVRGDMYATLNRNEESRQALQRALELEPEMLTAYTTLWYSYLFKEPTDLDASQAAIERCIEIDPGEARFREMLGDTLRARGDLEEARAAYGRAIELDTNDEVAAVARLKKGHINSFLGRFEEARADYDQGLQLADPSERPEYVNYRAFTHLHQDDPQSALDELRELDASVAALDLPDSRKLAIRGFTLDNAARIALHYGLLDRAEEILATRTAVVRANSELVGDPDFTRRQEAHVLQWQAELLARRGLYDQALARAEEHRALLEADANPRRFETYHALRGLIDLLQERYAAAIDHLEQADLEEIYVKYHLALAHQGAGDTERAEELFREVGEWNFNSVDFAILRRDALRRAG